MEHGRCGSRTDSDFPVVEREHVGSGIPIVETEFVERYPMESRLFLVLRHSLSETEFCPSVHREPCRRGARSDSHVPVRINAQSFGVSCRDRKSASGSSTAVEIPHVRRLRQRIYPDFEPVEVGSERLGSVLRNEQPVPVRVSGNDRAGYVDSRTGASHAETDVSAVVGYDRVSDGSGGSPFRNVSARATSSYLVIERVPVRTQQISACRGIRREHPERLRS